MQFIPVLATLTFAAQETLLSIFKTVALLNILVETMIIFFQDSFMVQKNCFFRINVNVFTVTFNQFNASLLTLCIASLP